MNAGWKSICSPRAISAALGVDLSADLVVLALTHRSYAYEHGGLPTNERLEFLGDAVLGVVITETLYRTHPDLQEGRLAKLRAATARFAARMGWAAVPVATVVSALRLVRPG